MKEFDWNAFGNLKNKIVVHCRTLEEAKDFCVQSHLNGFDWMSGKKRNQINTEWEFYKEETCYRKNTYCNAAYYVACECTILEWKDYSSKTQIKFK